MDELNKDELVPEQELPPEETPPMETPPAQTAPEEVPSPDEIDVTKPIVPKRVRRPSPTQIFKEQYLPFLILGVAAVMIVVFLFGSISNRRDQTARENQKARIEALLSQEVASIKEQSALLAAEYDYEGAMKLLAGYSGGLANEPSLLNLYNQYQSDLNALVVWDDLSQIPNLSFRTLVADLARAKADPDRGSRYGKSYITTDEFAAILQQLYEGGYVLVSLYDFAEPGTDAEGGVTVQRTSIRLPEGKKPVILTQEGVNFYDHTQKSGGFANCLALDGNGELTAVMTDADGNVTTGNFDFVPVLNAFLKEHPDFSYEGARATIAVSGYEGLFGYDLSDSDKIKEVLNKLRSDGYDIACYTYADMKYAEYGVAGLKDDLKNWSDKITPILGDVDILVYPSGSDIRGQEAYSGSKYDALHDFGFRYFVGTGSGSSWALTTGEYARHTRTVVTASNLASNPEYYSGLFDAATVLSSERGA